MLTKEYKDKVVTLLEEVSDQQVDTIEKVAKVIANSLKEDGLLHLFGCGHSHMLVEEVFYRAGGLVPINPILETSTMLHEGAVKSSKVERMQGYAAHILDNYYVKEGEVIVIISNSGINSLPIEMAMEAKKKGLTVIAITSSAYFDKEPRHPSGKKLYECADIVIDNQLPYGDALVQVPESDIKMAPGSSIIGTFIMNMLMIRIVEELHELGVTPPVYVSGNVDGGMEYNMKYINKYKKRIKHL